MHYYNNNKIIQLCKFKYKDKFNFLKNKGLNQLIFIFIVKDIIIPIYKGVIVNEIVFENLIINNIIRYTNKCQA